MGRLRIYQVDAFADAVFQGNPAAVVPLFDWLADDRLQGIAAENNLSETAFFVPRGDDYHLRWFTPTAEVALCGHATLASAFVIFNDLEAGRRSVRFRSKSGELGVEQSGDRLTLDFPAARLTPCEPPPDLLAGLGAVPAEVHRTLEDPNYYAVFAAEDDVRSLTPDLSRLALLHPHGTVATAPGAAADFVSRYFAPSYGIPEDPATGSTHCGLTPYWAGRLEKADLRARQLSSRGAELYCSLRGDRVAISGKAVKYLEGWIWV